MRKPAGTLPADHGILLMLPRQGSCPDRKPLWEHSLHEILPLKLCSFQAGVPRINKRLSTMGHAAQPPFFLSFPSKPGNPE